MTSLFLLSTPALEVLTGILDNGDPGSLEAGSCTQGQTRPQEYFSKTITFGANTNYTREGTEGHAP